MKTGASEAVPGSTALSLLFPHRWLALYLAGFPLCHWSGLDSSKPIPGLLCTRFFGKPGGKLQGTPECPGDLFGHSCLDPS